MVVKDTAVRNQIDITGTIDANERVNLISQTAGNITGIYFTEGTKVQKGQLLVKFITRICKPRCSNTGADDTCPGY
jgi:membrane fusion protein (multidrug efflux system)